MKKIIFFCSVMFIMVPILFISSCSKSDNGYGNNNNTGGSGTTTNAATVKMKGSAFSPATVNLYINGKITWTNDDNTVHTVTATDGSFNSGDMQPGASFTHTFSGTGTINYHCIHHSNMTGTVVVVTY